MSGFYNRRIEAKYVSVNDEITGRGRVVDIVEYPQDNSGSRDHTDFVFFFEDETRMRVSGTARVCVDYTMPLLEANSWGVC